jgi:hypothetical protein
MKYLQWAAVFAAQFIAWFSGPLTGVAVTGLMLALWWFRHQRTS